MNAKAKINDIVEAIDFQWNDETHAYFEKSTGKVWLLADDILEAAEENDEENIMFDYVEEDLEFAKKLIQFPDNFIELPSKYDIDDHSIMEDFCSSIENGDLQHYAFIAIKGKGAFNRFKELMHYHGLIDDWYKYRDKKIKQQAREWCKFNKIEYIDIE